MGEGGQASRQIQQAEDATLHLGVLAWLIRPVSIQSCVDRVKNTGSWARDLCTDLVPGLRGLVSGGGSELPGDGDCRW